MERKIFNISNFRVVFQKSKLICPTRCYSNDINQPTRSRSLPEKQNKNAEDITPFQSQFKSSVVEVKYWNERAAIKKEKRAHSFPNSVKHVADVIRFFQSWNDFPLSLEQLRHFILKRYVRNQLIEQKYLPKRVAILKPDLAAAHFIARRGGSIKFVGDAEWIGYNEKKKFLPMAYVPGLFIESIKAEGTSLFCEGLENLAKLHHLSYLSLKNLDTVDDWFLDLISQQHYYNLKHLDISGCKNVTFRSLSCFYRFENLEILEVEGVPDTVEFKLACLMLLEIMPFLDIRGIDLSIPTEIKPVAVEEKKLHTET